MNRDNELLSSYLDGELTPAEQALLEQRLETDDSLRADLNSLKRLSNLLMVDALDKQVALHIQETLARTHKDKKRKRLLWLRFAPLAAFMILGVSFIASTHEPQVTITQEDIFSEYSDALKALGD